MAEIPGIDGRQESCGSLAVKLMDEKLELPVWVSFGRSRHLITEESRRGIATGLMIALEIRAAAQDDAC